MPALAPSGTNDADFRLDTRAEHGTRHHASVRHPAQPIRHLGDGVSPPESFPSPAPRSSFCRELGTRQRTGLAARPHLGQNPGHAGAALGRNQNGSGGFPPFFGGVGRINPRPLGTRPGFCPEYARPHQRADNGQFRPCAYAPRTSTTVAFSVSDVSVLPRPGGPAARATR
jgi:hypothetical protein